MIRWHGSFPRRTLSLTDGWQRVVKVVETKTMNSKQQTESQAETRLRPSSASSLSGFSELQVQPLNRLNSELGYGRDKLGQAALLCMLRPFWPLMNKRWQMSSCHQKLFETLLQFDHWLCLFVYHMSRKIP